MNASLSLYQVNIIKFYFALFLKLFTKLRTHICEKYITLLRESIFKLAVLNSNLAGINPDNRHRNILWILFGNTHAHNRCRIIGRSERWWWRQSVWMLRLSYLLLLGVPVNNTIVNLKQIVKSYISATEIWKA